MPEKFLYRAQVAACRQKVRGKGMAHGLGRGAGGQAQLQAGLFHHQSDQPGVQRATAGAAKQGIIPGQVMRAEFGVAGHGLARGGQDGDKPGLAAHPGDAQHFGQW